MFIHYRTQAFVLKKDDQGEANQLLTVYTKDFGKLKILARAIRKISSKLRSGAELFYFSEIEFIQGKAYKTLTDAILIDKFKNLRKDPIRLSFASKISEVFDRLIKGEEADEKIWQLLKETFERLDQSKIEKSKLKIIYYYFLWNLFSLLGYQPEFYNCLQCQKKLVPEKIYFSAQEGGIICQNCLKKVKSTREIDLETVKILRIILEKNWTILFRLKIEKLDLETLNAFSNYYFSEILKQVNN